LGLTVAYVTHDQSEALAVSDQIIVMDGGNIAQAGTPQALYERPATAFVAGFMGEAMLFDGHSLADGSVQVGPLQFAPRIAVAAGAAKAAIRPEAWRIVPRSEASLGGPLVKQAYLGSFQELTIDTVLGPVFVVSPQVERQWILGEELGLALGEHGVTVVAV
jgi:iron(III) transport system ATP-binding protein